MLELLAAAMMASALSAAETPCRETRFEGDGYVVCVFDPLASDIRLFLHDDAGAPWRHFGPLADNLEEKGETLTFAMNAGMYHQDRSPVGGYIEDNVALTNFNANDGPGNFHMKPNGVFYIGADGRAFIETTTNYLRIKQRPPRYATQSGPMLVVADALHPRFLPGSDSLKRRNGVGVREDGAVLFAISDDPVRFYDFARFFRDKLRTPNALFLDGSISRLYAPSLNRNEPGVAMGPIVGVVRPMTKSLDAVPGR